MSKLFSNLKTDGLEEAKDVIGGGFRTFETDVYENVKLKLAYTALWQGGSRYVSLVFDIDGAEYEESITITNSAGDNYYMKDGKKNQMPGFVTVNELCMAATGEELSELNTEERQVEVWDSKEKKKVRQARDVIVELCGTDVSLAIRKVLEPKTEKSNKVDDKGKPIYEEIDGDYTKNEIVKVFHAETRATIAEIKKAQKDDKDIEAKFMDQWKEKWQGSTYNKRKGNGKSGAGSTGSGAPKSSGADKPKTSLFKK